MKPITLLLLSLFAVNCFAQSDAAKPTTTAGFKRIYIGISTTQGVGYRLLSRNPDVGAADGLENVRDGIISSRNEREKPDYATNVGFRFGVNATKWFAIETGVEYGYNSYGYKLDNLLFGQNWNGNSFDSASASVKFKAQYHYINVPLALNFTIGSKKTKAIISAGSYFSFLVNRTSRSSITFSNSSTPYVSDNTALFQSFNISPFLGIGIDYQINSLMSLRVMPLVQFQALQNYRDAPITERLYSGGINISLNFGFVDVQAKAAKE